MILVTGASGITGLAVIRKLTAAGVAVRALARDARGAARLAAAGASEVIEGGFESDTLRRACRSAEAVYHICPNVHPDEIGIGTATVAAARAASVRHFVFHSVIQPQIRAMPHHWAKLEVEGLVIASGLPYTILQPTVYMQNLRFQWPDILARGEYAQPYSAFCRLTLVDLDDVADAAARVLLSDDWRNTTLELAGTAPLDRHEMAAVIERVLERPVRATRLDLQSWRQTAARTLGAEAVDRLEAMFRWYDGHGLPAGSPRVLALVLGREPTAFETFVRTLAEHG